MSAESVKVKAFVGGLKDLVTEIYNSDEPAGELPLPLAPRRKAQHHMAVAAGHLTEAAYALEKGLEEDPY